MASMQGHPPGLLSQADSAGIVELVDINDVKFRAFLHDGERYKATIGVRGLAACTVIVIASGEGAIVAHVGPNILGSEAPDSYITLAGDMMDRLSALYQEHSSVFPQTSTTHVIYATSGGQATLQEQVAVLRQRLSELRLPNVKWTSYIQSRRADINDVTPLGTVLVDGRDQVPKVLLEDRDISVTAWVFIEDKSLYYEMGAGGSIVQSSTAPPSNVWIQKMYSNRQTTGEILWDGFRWHTRNQSETLV